MDLVGHDRPRLRERRDLPQALGYQERYGLRFNLELEGDWQGRGQAASGETTAAFPDTAARCDSLRRAAARSESQRQRTTGGGWGITSLDAEHSIEIKDPPGRVPQILAAFCTCR